MRRAGDGAVERRAGAGGAASNGPVSSRMAIERCMEWLCNPSKVMRWLGKYDLKAMLKQEGGLVKIPNFFPPSVAQGILAMIEGIKEDEWVITEADRDPSSNNISHRFWSTKKAEGLDEIVRALSVLLPEQFNSFSAGKYERSHHIEPHDDRAYTDVMVEDGSVVKCSRDVALIYYLTQDWKTEYGGVLVDVPTGRRFTPEFNSVVLFQVPRYHEVTAVKVERPRYSIFGWFLKEGISYELFRGEGGGADGGSGGYGGYASSNTTQSKPNARTAAKPHMGRGHSPRESMSADRGPASDQTSTRQSRSPHSELAHSHLTGGPATAEGAGHGRSRAPRAAGQPLGRKARPFPKALRCVLTLVRHGHPP